MTTPENSRSMSSPIREVSFIEASPGLVKLVVLSRFCMSASLSICGETFSECRNRIEPYDFLTHVFLVPEPFLRQEGYFVLSFDYHEKEAEFRQRHFKSGSVQMRITESTILRKEALLEASLNGLRLVQDSRHMVAPGVTCSQSLYLDRTGAPVRVWAMLADNQKAGIAVGTPEDDFVVKDCRQSVLGMMRSALAKGKQVLAAVNGDFFDLFGDFSPSGPCFKDGQRIWAGDETRPILGQNSDGSLFISKLSDRPPGVGTITQAVAGMSQILKNGQPHELLLGEPFGDQRHPRTAAGLGRDGLLILLVVDGRIPEHSNGVSLADLAQLMKDFGALDALNLDGGGSSILVLNRDGDFTVMNRPADLFKPKDNLIREVSNSVLLVYKDCGTSEKDPTAGGA